MENNKLSVFIAFSRELILSIMFVFKYDFLLLPIWSALFFLSLFLFHSGFHLVGFHRMTRELIVYKVLDTTTKWRNLAAFHDFTDESVQLSWYMCNGLIINWKLGKFICTESSAHWKIKKTTLIKWQKENETKQWPRKRNQYKFKLNEQMSIHSFVSLSVKQYPEAPVQLFTLFFLSSVCSLFFFGFFFIDFSHQGRFFFL